MPRDLSNADLHDLARVAYDLTVRVPAHYSRRTTIDLDATAARFRDEVGTYDPGVLGGSIRLGDIVAIRGTGTIRLGFATKIGRTTVTVEYQPVTATKRSKTVNRDLVVAHQPLNR
jgi:hypothetical protein